MLRSDDEQYIREMDTKFKAADNKNYQEAAKETREASNDAKKNAAEKILEMEAEGTHFSKDTNRYMADMQQSQKECNDGVRHFIDDEHKAEDEVNSAVSQYNNEKAIDEEKLGVEGRNFEKQSAMDTGKEVEDMDGTVRDLKNAKARIERDIGRFEDKENRQIDQYKNDADRASKAIGKEADEVFLAWD